MQKTPYKTGIPGSTKNFISKRKSAKGIAVLAAPVLLVREKKRRCVCRMMILHRCCQSLINVMLLWWQHRFTINRLPHRQSCFLNGSIPFSIWKRKIAATLQSLGKRQLLSAPFGEVRRRLWRNILYGQRKVFPKWVQRTQGESCLMAFQKPVKSNQRKKRLHETASRVGEVAG